MVPQAPFADLLAANASAAVWCAEVNAAIHSEICAVPVERLETERGLLAVLPSLRPELLIVREWLLHPMLTERSRLNAGGLCCRRPADQADGRGDQKNRGDGEQSAAEQAPRLITVSSRGPARWAGVPPG